MSRFLQQVQNKNPIKFVESPITYEIFASYVFDKFRLLAIILKALLGLPDNEVIEEIIPLPCKFFPAHLNRMGKDDEKVLPGDLVGGKVIEFDFLYHIRIRVSSPQGGVTYRTLNVNVECQRSRQGYMLKRALYYVARLLCNGLSKGQGFLDLIPAITLFLSHDGLKVDPKDNPGLFPYRKAFRLNDFDPKDPHKTVKTSDDIELNIIAFKLFNKKIDELKTYQDWVFFILANFHKLTEEQSRIIEERGGDMAVLYKGLQEISNNPDFGKAYAEWLATAEADNTDLKDTATYARREGIKEGRAEGIEKGIEKGRKEAAMVLSLHIKNHSAKTIAQKTNLSVQEVQQLLKALETT